ncbi:hypothetical protein H0H93_007889 [Arthromyces matolae]|nr:hypothetical protein H0H93_007889 [Arthromyces matolae]
MSSAPTPPPPGDNSLDSWQKYEAKAVKKDKEADKEAIDKMLEFQKQFVLPSKSVTPPPPARVSPPIGGNSLVSLPDVIPVVEPLSAIPIPSPSEGPVGVSLDPTAGSSLGPLVSSSSSDVAPPLPPVAKKSSTLRKMSSKPDVTEADRKRINAELKSVSRAQFLAAVEGVGNPSEDWWKEHSPCQRCGPSGDCIPHRFKKFPLTSCELCHGKKLPCSIKINWQITEVARRHPEWPRWWIIEREREGWMKKTRGAKVDSGAGSSSKVSSKSKGKRKAQSEEEESDSSSSQDADGDSDPEAVVEVARRSIKRPRLATTAASHEYRPYSKPPGPSPLPGRPMARPAPLKTSQVREVFVLVPPLIAPQVSDAAQSKAKTPLFAPSETPDVVVISPSPSVPPPPPAPVLVPDPKSPLNIRIPPRPLRLPSPPASTSLRAPPPSSPDLETRNQVFEGTQFSRGDVIRGRLADARRQSLVFGRGLKQFTTHASAWSLQLESFRREFREHGFEPSPMSTRFFDNVIEESRRMALYWGDALNEGDCEHMRSVTAGVGMPSQQDLIDEMDKEGMDARWEQ